MPRRTFASAERETPGLDLRKTTPILLLGIHSPSRRLQTALGEMEKEENLPRRESPTPYILYPEATYPLSDSPRSLPLSAAILTFYFM